MANILFGVTGSVAAIKTPELFAALKDAGHQVKVVATAASLYFFDPKALAPTAAGERNPEVVILDEDEWPGAASGQRYQRGDKVLHIELRRWANMLVIAPLDANTLAKLANGLCDNCLTCVWRAWDRHNPVILAPAMNTLMWEHPLTRRHLQQLADSLGPSEPTEPGFDLLDMCAWMNCTCPALRVLMPEYKTLACGDVGIGGMAPLDRLLGSIDYLLRARASNGDLTRPH